MDIRFKMVSEILCRDGHSGEVATLLRGLRSEMETIQGLAEESCQPEVYSGQILLLSRLIEEMSGPYLFHSAKEAKEAEEAY